MLKQLRTSLLALTLCFAFAPELRAEDPRTSRLQCLAFCASVLFGAFSGFGSAVIDAQVSDSGATLEKAVWTTTFLTEGALRFRVVESLVKWVGGSACDFGAAQIYSRILSYVVYYSTYNKRVPEDKRIRNVYLIQGIVGSVFAAALLGARVPLQLEKQ